jgi:hypothetical protein
MHDLTDHCICHTYGSPIIIAEEDSSDESAVICISSSN